MERPRSWRPPLRRCPSSPRRRQPASSNGDSSRRFRCPKWTISASASGDTGVRATATGTCEPIAHGLAWSASRGTASSSTTRQPRDRRRQPRLQGDAKRTAWRTPSWARERNLYRGRALRAVLRLGQGLIVVPERHHCRCAMSSARHLRQRSVALARLLPWEFPPMFPGLFLFRSRTLVCP